MWLQNKFTDVHFFESALFIGQGERRHTAPNVIGRSHWLWMGHVMRRNTVTIKWSNSLSYGIPVAPEREERRVIHAAYRFNALMLNGTRWRNEFSRNNKPIIHSQRFFASLGIQDYMSIYKNINIYIPMYINKWVA